MFNLNWTVNEAEDMDIFSYLDILAYRIHHSDKEKGEHEKDVYIDEIFGL